MKKILVLFLIVIVFSIMLAACSSNITVKSDGSENEQTTFSTQSEENQNTVIIYPTSSVNTTYVIEYVGETTIPATADSIPEYTKEANELEILGPDNNTNSTTDKTEPVTEAPAQDITEPLNPFTNGEPIELPFVPAE